MSHRDLADGGGEVEQFLTRWIAFEKLERKILRTRSDYRPGAARGALHRYGVIDEELQRNIERCRRMRNEVMHGKAPIPTQALIDAATSIDRVTRQLARQVKLDRSKDS